MKMKVYRYSGALRRIAWVLLLPAFGCGSGTQSTPSATPSGSETAGSEQGHVPEPKSTPDLLGAERLAYEQVRPIFEQYCARCHTTTGAKATKKTLGHFNMNDYPFGGHHRAEIAQSIRKVLGATGKKATMPRNDPGAVQGEELTLVLDWADSFDRAAAAGLHSAEPDHHGHAH